MAAVEFGTGKTIFILAIVVGCFAVLWPKIFYPMLQASINVPVTMDNSQGCCDVIFEKDINALRIVSEMCGNAPGLKLGVDGKPDPKACREEVLLTCGVDIADIIRLDAEVSSLYGSTLHGMGAAYRHRIQNLRAYNTSLCLKRNFGLDPGTIGAPRRMRLGPAPPTPKHLRPERPPHLHPEMLHPALREKGRAIVPPSLPSSASPIHQRPPPPIATVPILESRDQNIRPGPIPGMRPPLGGPGHVVPPPPRGSGTMGIVMPLYTMGIVIFFVYTMMKVLFKKNEDAPKYRELSIDPEFHHMIFQTNEEPPQRTEKCNGERETLATSCPLERKAQHREITRDGGTKLVVTAISGLLAEVDHQRDLLEEKKKTKQSEEILEPLMPKGEDLSTVNNSANEINGDFTAAEFSHRINNLVPDGNNENSPLNEAEHKMKVLGMEATASWASAHRPPTPIVLVAPSGSTASQGATPLTSESTIFVEGGLMPSHSGLLVSQSECEAFAMANTDEAEVEEGEEIVLSGKVTLSLIPMDHKSEIEQEKRRVEIEMEDEPAELEEESDIEVEDLEEDIQVS